MDAELVKLLESDGWEVECENPLEIRHAESESFASGWAAQIVFDLYRTGMKRIWNDED